MRWERWGFVRLPAGGRAWRGGLEEGAHVTGLGEGGTMLPNAHSYLLIMERPCKPTQTSSSTTYRGLQDSPLHSHPGR